MKNIILPLADNEEQRIPNFKDVKFFKMYTKDIKNQYSSSWYCEVGKMIQWSINFDAESRHGGYSAIGLMNFNKTYGIVQNRRFFKDLDELMIHSNNEVILSEKEWLGGLSIIDQFYHCHQKYFAKFLQICKNLEINETLLQEGYLCPHNIFLSKIGFLYDYSSFLKEFLDPFFDHEEKDKVGAWISERLLHIFAYSYYKVKTAPIITLPK